MSLHTKLEQKLTWYKKWHRFRYAEAVHFFIILAFSLFDLYLALQVNQAIASVAGK